jgi:biopolymer transport protein ExbB/TolQ
MVVLLVLLVLGFVGALACAWWARRIWKRRRNLPLFARAIAAIAAASMLFGMLGTVIGLVKAFGAVGGESVDPSQKARILAEGISEAMNCTAFGIVVWVPSVVVLIFLMRRRSERSE